MACKKDIAFLDEIGKAIIIEYVDCDTAIDISSYGTRVIIFTSPSGVRTEYNAIFNPDGLNGQIKYVLTGTEFGSEPGIWEIQGRIEKLGVIKPSEIGQIEVLANL